MENINGVEEQVSVTVHDFEAAAYDSDCESSGNSGHSGHGFEAFTRNGLMVKLEEGNEHNVMKRSFLKEMGFIGREINVIAIHKNSCTSVNGKAKMDVFRVFSQAVAAKRGGNANVKFAWYGGSRDEICDIIAYGFGRCTEFEGVSHGIGVCLSPVNVPLDSAMRAKEDQNGVRHLLLCRVILGNPETICAGSQQFLPSSDHFDSGVDNPLAPKKYIIWSAYMNSHIFPNYIISFTVNSTGRSSNSAMNLRSPGMRLCKLVNVLSRFLDPSKIGLLWNHYSEFRDNKIDRLQLIRRLRYLVGDSTLISVVKLCRDESL